jgi:hypothetical protein
MPKVLDFVCHIHKFYFDFQELITRIEHIKRWILQDFGILTPTFRPLF